MSKDKSTSQLIMLLISTVFFTYITFSNLITAPVNNTNNILDLYIYKFSDGRFCIGLFMLMVYLKYISIIKSDIPIKVCKIIGIVFSLVSLIGIFRSLYDYFNILLLIVSTVATIGVLITTDYFLFNVGSLNKKILYTILIILAMPWVMLWGIISLTINLWESTELLNKLPFLVNEIINYCIPYITLIIAVWMNKMPAKAAVDDNNTDSTDLIN